MTLQELAKVVRDVLDAAKWNGTRDRFEIDPDDLIKLEEAVNEIDE